MRIRLVAAPVAVDVAAGLAFALAWGLRWQGCAPPSVACSLPGVACAAVCTDPWPQWPTTFSWGLLLGVVPSLLAFVLVSRGARSSASTFRLTLGLSGISVLLAAMGMDSAFLFPGPGPWILLLAAGAGFALGWLLLRATTAPGFR